MPRRSQGRQSGRASLAACLVAVGALLFAAPANAEQAKAGPFYKQGMQAMWDIGMALPDADAQIHIRSCRVTPQKAVCAMRVAVSGHEPCEGTAILHKRSYALPERLWGCPAAWRPVLVELPDGLTYAEQMEKALADRHLRR